MKKDKIILIIIKLLEKRGSINLKKKQAIEDYNFFKNGHIDSVGLIKFIFELETKFKVNLSIEETSNKNFATIKGLANIILKELKK